MMELKNFFSKDTIMMVAILKKKLKISLLKNARKLLWRGDNISPFFYIIQNFTKFYKNGIIYK